MAIAGISPSLAAVADFLRKGAALSPGEWRIHESAIRVIDMQGFVRRQFPHAH